MVNIRNRARFGMVVLLTWALTTSGMAGSALIASGTYRDPSKMEAVTVQGEEIEFEIRISEGNRERLAKRKYGYRLLSDSGIHVIGSSNDSIFVFGVLKYDWFWDGKTILRKTSNGGDVTVFQRE